MNDVVTVFWLKSLKGFGNITIQKLYQATGEHLNNLWQMTAQDLKKLNILSASQIRDLLNQRDRSFFEEQVKQYGAKDIAIVCPWDSTNSCAHYPEGLRHIYDSPVILYMKGRMENLALKGIAVVGTRNPTDQGLKTSSRFSGQFAKSGLAVVSGLAEGIDAAAHLGALNEKGATIAVLGSGIDQAYPSINKGLYERMAQNGLIISEYPMGMQPQKGYFSKRNRLISGLAEAVVIVEASTKSGSLITANYGLDQGKSIFAVPGSIYNSRYEGCHALIRQGGQLITTAQQVLDELATLTHWDPRVVIGDKSEHLECYHGLYGRLWQLIKEEEPVMLEDLLKEVNADRATVFQYTLDLMLDGVVERGIDGAFRTVHKD